MNVQRAVTAVFAALLFVVPQRATGGATVELAVDCAASQGEIRPLHGVNNGPLDVGGTVDLSAYYRELAIPLVRLHDAHWPNPDVVDIHVVFPNFNADPAKPENYDFSATDEYLKAIHATGAQIVYRLGESIEHTKVKHHVHPPSDPRKWAAVCLGIIRHCNNGWAGGLHLEIRHWEIWNEPDNRPNMWTGNDEEFFRLFATAAKSIRSEFPEIRIGGPALGNTGKVIDGQLALSPFLSVFLAFCKRESVPLDFFSWHMYSADPHAIATQSRAVREALDERGFGKTESHLNEWNYLPDDDWSPILLPVQGVARERFYERIGGAEGAAFTTVVLMLLQDCPVDAANYYAGDTNPFGLFTRHAVPRKNFYAFKAFQMLRETPGRVKITSGDTAGVAACAGLNKDHTELIVLVSNFKSAENEVRITVKNLPWSRGTSLEVCVLDADRDLDKTARSSTVDPMLPITQALHSPGVCVLRFRRM